MNRRDLLAGAAMAGSGGLLGSHASADQSSNDDLSGKTFSGPFNFHTNGQRVSLTTGDAPHLHPEAALHIINDTVSCGLRVQAYWAGSAEAPYQNHDASLYEVFNKTETNSRNRSWAGSFCNAFNDIPAGVEDTGTRVGIIGWAPSVAKDSYVHEGTLTQQVGVYGTAGFQSPGSGPNAVVVEAVGVRGVILTGSPGAKIRNAIAGQFVTRATESTIERNTAVYASARGGLDNYSFYGGGGTFFNEGQILAGNEKAQTNAFIAARSAGNGLEFGHPDQAGYGCAVGATQLTGFPFIALNADADESGDTFQTRGKRGVVVTSDLVGSLVFSRLTDPDASGQEPKESARLDADGHLVLAETPVLKSKTPASASDAGTPGEVCWADDYVYVCVAKDTWKRAALSSW